MVGVIVDILRNLPLLLIIFFSYFGLPVMGIRVDAFQASVIAMVVFESAMIAEVVRSGINSVDPGQMEGARSNGMTYWQAMRYVILPQAFKIVIPALGNQFVNLIKNSSILAFVAGFDLMYQGDIVASNTFQTIPSYVLVGIFYLILTLPMSYSMQYLEKKTA